MSALFASALMVEACGQARSGEGDASVSTRVDALEAVAAARAKVAVERSNVAAKASLPEVANGSARIVDPGSDVAIDVALIARPVVGALVGDGARVFERALDGADLVWTARPDGVEDFAYFPARPVRSEARYGLRTSSGVRWIGDVVEVLDRGGAPRLRMSPPRIVDAHGTVHVASVAVEGCVVDRAPSPPWGRTFAPAGTCEIVIRWRDDLAYPAVLDPTWTTTASMSSKRFMPGASRLADGRVLVMGGYDGAVYLKTAEVYDPTSGTWAATGSMTTGRSTIRAHTLPDGTVLATTGSISDWDGSSDTDLWDPKTGAWIAMPPIPEPRAFAMSVQLTGGRVLVVGGRTGYSGMSSTGHVFDPATRTWSAAGTLFARRERASLSLLADGRALLVGGSNVTPDSGYPTGTPFAEIFDPATGVWTRTADLATQRAMHSATTLPSGKVLVAGGFTAQSSSSWTSLSSTELYDPASKTWSPGPSLVVARDSHSATTMWNGKILFAGGLSGQFAPLGAAELYDPATNAFTATVGMANAHWGHAAVSLPTFRVLIAGGTQGSWNNQKALTTAISELYAASPLGAPCTLAADCSSGFCVDGVCCDAACTGTCNACTADKKGSGADGTCAPVAAGTDPRNDCTDDGAATCGKNGLCDGAGACQNYPVTTGCSPRPCAAGADCTSGHCTEGICCDTACTSSCTSCLAARKGPGGKNGVCENLPDGSNAKGGCLPDVGFPGSCKADGSCDGAGACRPNAKAGTVCGSVSCVSAKLTAATCNGTGICVMASTECAPFTCASATSCASSCITDAECKAGSAYCAADRTCQPLRAKGAACSRDAECDLGHCVDGVCCDTACSGTCSACTAAKKGSGADGECGNIASGSDPDGECPDDGAASCHRTGSCDGKGGCALYAPGTACGAGTCADGKSTALRCDGVGTCATTTTVDCGGFACVGGVCKTDCATDADCSSSSFCDAGVCKPRGANGATCSDARTCASGFCVDGVCCAAPCDGQCEACNVEGALGACVPVAGDPHGERTPCASATSGAVCAAAKCDGIERKSCLGFVTSATLCQAPSCKDGVASFEARCDGRGKCATADTTKKCDPYACNEAATACKDACANDADCAPGRTCDVASRACVASGKCDGDHTVISADGSKTSDCSPYRCESAGRCKALCGTSDDCVGGSLCDASGRCVAAPTAEGDGGGCATGRAPASAAEATLVSLAVLALLTRKRRR